MSNLSLIGKALIVSGMFLVFAGIIVILGKNIPLMSRLGRLPGDIRIEKEGFSFFFPITTCLLFSAILTLLSLIYRYFFKN